MRQPITRESGRVAGRSGKTADHDADHRPADHRLRMSGVGRAVPRGAPVGGKPREGALHRPPLELALEAALDGILANDLQVTTEDLGGPLDKATGEPLVGPDLLEVEVVEPGP